MKIDRSNYETWFIDWLDGNLNETQAGHLRVFLDENPDLALELKEFNEFRLIACENEFIGKTSMLRTPSDLSEDQFDNLCARFVENDLSFNEKNELLEIISADPERKKIFDLFSKLKLVPHKISYKHKKKLLRITPLQKVIRLSVTALSAAASIAVLIVSTLFHSDKVEDNNTSLSQFIEDDGRVIHSSVPIAIAEYISKTDRPVRHKIKSYSVAANNITTPVVIPGNNQNSEDEQTIQRVNLLTTVDLPDYSNIDLVAGSGKINKLQEINFSFPEVSEDRWAVGKFLAKSFRENILKQETTDESPLKGYEIAEAGVTGINKLLGWQMALEKESDPNGEVKSVYFSSKILKIQTPVNKPESAE